MTGLLKRWVGDILPAPTTHPPSLSPELRSPPFPPSRTTLPALPFLQVNEHKHLAPRKAVLDGDTEAEAAECPICFLNFEALNEATCCKQMVCTDCYLLVKNTPKGPPQCPFCSHKVLIVRYTPSAGDAAEPSSLGTFKQAAAALLPPSISPRGAAASPPAGKAPGGAADSASNTTPGKTAGTADGPVKKSPATPVHVPLASVTDRQQLEREIQSLRNRYADDEPPQVRLNTP